MNGNGNGNGIEKSVHRERNERKIECSTKFPWEKPCGPQEFWILLPSTPPHPTPPNPRCFKKLNNVGATRCLTIICSKDDLKEKHVGSIYQPLKSKSFPQAKNITGPGFVWGVGEE